MSFLTDESNTKQANAPQHLVFEVDGTGNVFPSPIQIDAHSRHSTTEKMKGDSSVNSVQSIH